MSKNIRITEPSAEMLGKIIRAREAIAAQKPRYIKCPYCQHNSIVVYEDTPAVLYAAKESGAKAAAIAESVWQDHWPEMQKKCDIAIKDYRDLLAQNPKT